MKTYIYIIENKLNGDSYVGKTVNIERRWKKHLSNVGCGDTHLSRAMRKHGVENFDFKIVDEHEEESYALNVLEPMWISKLRESGVHLYNMTEGGEGISGFAHSEQTIAKMSQSQTGRVISEETKQKIREKLAGVRPSDESIAKIREKLKGKKKPTRSAAHCQKLSEAAQTRGPMSEEQKKKISDKMKTSDKVGHPIDEATRLKIAEALRGQVQSEETRAKRAESMRRAWEKRRASSPVRPS